MELVYLWVEEYKNIKRQGFNFSPNYNVEFKPVYENKELLESSELIIKDKDNSVKYFFGKNINMTAIVGENGSGKSNIIDLLFNAELSKNIILLFRIEDKFYINKKVLSHTKLHINKNIFQNIDIDSLGGNLPIDDYDMDILFEKIFTTDPNTFDFIDSKLVFKYWKLRIDNKNFNDFKINLFPRKNIEVKDYDYLILFFGVAKRLVEKELLRVEFIGELNKDNYLKYISNIQINDFEEENKITLKVLTEFDDNVKKIKEYQSKNELKKDDISDMLNSDLYFTFNKFDNLELLKISYMTENEILYEDFSSGERQIIENIALLMGFYYFRLKNIGTALLLIDEPDSFIHPQWQKKIIGYYLTVLKKYLGDIYLNIVITTHSPFILSDFQEDNIIFLEKNGNNCVNVSDRIGINSFGANIHTLLSHGFFIKDGLIGNFAKSKIDKAIEYLNQKILTKEEMDYCENIIAIIGEPIIKRQLQKMLDSKRLSEIDVIKKQIEELQKELATKENKK